MYALNPTTELDNAYADANLSGLPESPRGGRINCQILVPSQKLLLQKLLIVGEFPATSILKSEQLRLRLGKHIRYMNLYNNEPSGMKESGKHTITLCLQQCSISHENL